VDPVRPTILFTDAIFPHDYKLNEHLWLADLSPYGVWSEHLITYRALSKVALVAFASEYAEAEAIRYGVPQGKACVVPYGANLDNPPRREVSAGRTMRLVVTKGHLDLLFVGKDWERKGGAIAIQVVRYLNAEGLSAHLHVVGCLPEVQADSGSVTFYGYLDKRRESDNARLEELYRQCDVLILPTKDEGFGVVFAEAAAFGLPSLAFNSAGVSTAVCNGQSGVLLPPQSTPLAFASVVLGWVANPSSYDALCVGARKYFEEVTNWDKAVSSLYSQIEKSNETR